MDNAPAVLITGCSTGVGHAVAERFLRRGHPVYATARHPESIADLAEAGATTLALDVTKEDSMVAAVERVEADHGSVGILVNNAAYGLEGAVERLSLEDVRTQFETNLFGVIRLCQLALPAMRRRRIGCIINVSAMGAHFTLPGTSALHASKHALRSVTNALRMEVRGFGIDVSMVEPGPIRTAFPGRANATLPLAQGSSPYDGFHLDVAARLDAAYEPRRVNLVLSADAVARAVERAALSRRPKARYPVGLMSRSVILLSKILPDAAIDALIRLQFPVPEPSVETSDASRRDVLADCSASDRER